MRGLKGKRTIVTGGGSGIGREVCKRFAEEGSEVAVFDINAAGATETVKIIGDAGGKATAHAVDITERAAVDAAVAEVEKGGPINVLVNNAGWDVPRLFLESDATLWKKVIDINLYGPLNMHHAVLPGMVRNGGGRVVNISSDAGRVGSSGEAVYSACKGGIIAFTKTVARELARKGIQLNAVAPGPTDTPLFAEFSKGGRRWRENRGRSQAFHSDATARATDRLPGDHLLPCLRRRWFHHRPSDFGLRRADDAWMTRATAAPSTCGLIRPDRAEIPYRMKWYVYAI